jgi:CheY-like chemotaxis protein
MPLYQEKGPGPSLPPDSFEVRSAPALPPTGHHGPGFPPGLPRIPIIAMAASSIRGDRERCLRAGMDDYPSEPVDLDELGQTPSRWLELPSASPGV